MTTRPANSAVPPVSPAPVDPFDHLHGLAPGAASVMLLDDRKMVAIGLRCETGWAGRIPISAKIESRGQVVEVDSTTLVALLVRIQTFEDRPFRAWLDPTSEMGTVACEILAVRDSVWLALANDREILRSFAMPNPWADLVKPVVATRRTSVRPASPRDLELAVASYEGALTPLGMWEMLDMGGRSPEG